MSRPLTRLELLISPRDGNTEIPTSDVSILVTAIDRLLLENGFVLDDANMYLVWNV